VKAAVCNVPHVFDVLLNLLESEYPVIQHQALVALSLAAENGVHQCFLLFIQFLLSPNSCANVT